MSVDGAVPVAEAITDLVAEANGRLREAGFVADDDGRDALSLRRRSRPADDPDGHFVVDEFAGRLPDADLPPDVLLLQTEVTAFNGDQSAALYGSAQRLHLQRHRKHLEVLSGTGAREYLPCLSAASGIP